MMKRILGGGDAEFSVSGEEQPINKAMRILQKSPALNMGRFLGEGRKYRHFAIIKRAHSSCICHFAGYTMMHFTINPLIFSKKIK